MLFNSETAPDLLFVKFFINSIQMVIVSFSSFLMDGIKNLNVIYTNVRKYT